MINPGSKRGYFIPNPTPIPKELGSARFSSVWDQWLQHRKEIRKPLTPTSTTQQLKKLATWGEDRAIAAIEHTIASGWQGIREPETTDRSPQSADDWQHVQAIVRVTYHPDLKNADDLRGKLTIEQFEAAKTVGLSRISSCDQWDRATPEAYRAARKVVAS